MNVIQRGDPHPGTIAPIPRLLLMAERQHRGTIAPVPSRDLLGEHGWTRLLHTDVARARAAQARANAGRSVSLRGFDLGDHQHVPIGVCEPHLLPRPWSPVDDLPHIDPAGEQLLA